MSEEHELLGGDDSPGSVRELRVFRVGRWNDQHTEVVDTYVSAHVAQVQDGALTFIEGIVLARQLVMMMRRAFKEWVDFEEIPKPPASRIVH